MGVASETNPWCYGGDVYVICTNIVLGEQSENLCSIKMCMRWHSPLICAVCILCKSRLNAVGHSYMCFYPFLPSHIHTHAHMYTYTHTPTPTHSHTHTPIPTPSHTHTHTPTHSHSHTSHYVAMATTAWGLYPRLPHILPLPTLTYAPSHPPPHVHASPDCLRH